MRPRRVRRTTTPCGPPAGTIRVVTDVVTTLDEFRNLLGAPLKARTDLEPSLPDLKINITDVTYAIEAFTGGRIPSAVRIVPCPD